jgi:phosphoglycolate phosphatase-like HAD superfamily hydrolase
MSTLYAFDFDGVICDSAIETAMSGWKAAQELWTDLPADLPSDLLEKFRLIRPVMETGYEAILILRLLFEGMSVEYLLAHFDKQIEVLMIRDELTVQELKQQFGETRDQWIADDLDSWVAMNPLYGPIADKLRQLNAINTVIITTKQERFVQQILSANQIQFPRESIYGLDRNMSKQHILHNLMLERPGDTILFIEDRLPTLINVIADAQLDPIVLYLANWGYNTDEDCEQASQRERLRLLDLSAVNAL